MLGNLVAVIVILVGEATFWGRLCGADLRPKHFQSNLIYLCAILRSVLAPVVGYEGSEKIVDYNPDWTVKTIRERAILGLKAHPV